MKCNTCGKMNCMAHGGGVHKPSYSSGKDMGQSESGDSVRQAFHMKRAGSPKMREEKLEGARDAHKDVLGEMRMMPKPKLKGLAKGGEVEDDEMKMYAMSPDVPSMHPKTMKDGGDVDKEDFDSIDNELNDIVMDELFDSMEKKDKKGCLDAIKALVLNCMGEK